MATDLTCTGAWIETFTGKKFHLLDPQPEEICIEDIAHALSNQCRYTGHVRRFFSVAEHSYHVSLHVEKQNALAGLMHDASEAYITDLSRPVKQLTPVGPPYYEIEDKIMRVIADKFGFAWPMDKDVKSADNFMLLLEKNQLMTDLSWDDDESGGAAARREVDLLALENGIRLVGYVPQVMKNIFLRRFEELTSTSTS